MGVSRETFVSVLRDQGAPVDDEALEKVVLAHDKRREGQISVDEFFKGVRFLQKAFVMASYGPKKKKASKGGKAKKKGKYILPFPICTVPPELIHRRADGGPPHFMIESYQHHTDPSRWDRDHPPGHPIEDDSAWYVEEPQRIFVNINHCAKVGELESLRLAFAQQVPVDVKDRFYKTPLMTACASANYEVAKFLISLGANVNACDQFNWTPLHHACHAGQVEIIDLLVQAGAGLDAPALNGATPLMRAIQSCRPNCVEYLINAGAKVQAQNKNGQNCLDIARIYADFRIMELVKAKYDTLPKPKENKRGKSFKPPPKTRPTTSTTEKALPAPPTLSIALSESTAKKEPLKESIMYYNTQITSGAINKIDISFSPRTVWGQQVTTSELIRRKEERRNRLSSEVDFEDFMMPFLKNIMKKSQELEPAHKE
ncbi:hypothetical protein AGOR_G00087420 [Albula goreensis]|uniref:EF-hand domain-containing protein n=1 Tax=Albula goreensis TaxID=1534307 RepID=A0A8T3DLF9_9TELE|nr:hypothetical protein AGOR_G00087420 [Albula goreensis]